MFIFIAIFVKNIFQMFQNNLIEAGIFACVLDLSLVKWTCLVKVSMLKQNKLTRLQLAGQNKMQPMMEEQSFAHMQQEMLFSFFVF